ncbi:MAG: iron-containing alcohol dehydrogenase [Candidatus Omnitrophica bacterium]|nr:iron-containing alcohol dehydrogenase [Candidatus Omnitrophota bacterium]
MINFTHNIPTIIYFGKGQVEAIEAELKKRAEKILVVTGQGSVKRNGIFDAVIKQVKKAKIPFIELSGILPNPRLKSVYQGIELCKKEKIDFILAVGGGSVIDASKAIACGVLYKGDVWDFFSKGVRPVKALPIGTVLTLAATGSEMNGNTVITKEDTKRKLAIGSPVLRPCFSVLDPEYTYTVNRYHTAAGVADIMAHIFEQYFSHTHAADVQDRIAEALLKVCLKYGPVACKKPADYDARANILWAGTLALNDLIGEGKEEDWASHAIEHELSAIYDISHGAGLAIVVPNWMKHVLSGKTINKFADYGINVWGIDKHKAKESIAFEAIEKTKNFFKTLGLPVTLKEVNIPSDHFLKMAQSAIQDWGKVGSFKTLAERDIVSILKSSL